MIEPDPDNVALFTADIHGNERQSRNLFYYAALRKIKYVFIGGDLAPQRLDDDVVIAAQREFLEQKLPRFILPFKDKNPDARVFLMMGNEDAFCNMDVLERDDGKLYTLIQNKRISLGNGFDVVGYPYVPITPFERKDWEKFDLSNVSERFAQEYLLHKQKNYDLRGITSFNGKWYKTRIEPGDELKDSIQRDLESELFTANPGQTIYVMHAPPQGTALDKIMDRKIADEKGILVPISVGSFAIREFIEKYQPHLTLHGHIHESADITGKFKEEIGKTVSILAGNYDDREMLSVIEFDIANPRDAVRYKL